MSHLVHGKGDANGRIRLKLLGEAGFSLIPPKEPGNAAKILIRMFDSSVCLSLRLIGR